MAKQGEVIEHSGSAIQMVMLPCACANLRRAARAVTQLYDQELRGSGLKSTQFTPLEALAEIPGTTQGGLGDLLALDSTTLTWTLRPLIRRGWVRERDRRERIYELTPAGRRELSGLTPRWELAQQRLRKALGASAWKQMQSGLGEIAEAARRA